MDQDREQRIRARAYEIWEREGQQGGSHLAHWEQAEKELQDEEAGEQQQDGESSGSNPSVEDEAGGQSADTGSTPDAPAKPRRSNLKNA